MCYKVSLSIKAGNIKAFRFVWAGITAPYHQNKYAAKILDTFLDIFPLKRQN
jgi:hypothetical protein